MIFNPQYLSRLKGNSLIFFLQSLAISFENLHSKQVKFKISVEKIKDTQMGCVYKQNTWDWQTLDVVLFGQEWTILKWVWWLSHKMIASKLADKNHWKKPIAHQYFLHEKWFLGKSVSAIHISFCVKALNFPSPKYVFNKIRHCNYASVTPHINYTINNPSTAAIRILPETVIAHPLPM